MLRVRKRAWSDLLVTGWIFQEKAGQAPKKVYRWLRRVRKGDWLRLLLWLVDETREGSQTSQGLCDWECHSDILISLLRYGKRGKAAVSNQTSKTEPDSVAPQLESPWLTQHQNGMHSHPSPSSLLPSLLFPLRPDLTTPQKLDTEQRTTLEKWLAWKPYSLSTHSAPTYSCPLTAPAGRISQRLRAEQEPWGPCFCQKHHTRAEPMMAFRHLPGTQETMLGFLYVPPHSCFHEPESHKPKKQQSEKDLAFSPQGFSTVTGTEGDGVQC